MRKYIYLSYQSSEKICYFSTSTKTTTEATTTKQETTTEQPTTVITTTEPDIPEHYEGK